MTVPPTPSAAAPRPLSTNGNARHDEWLEHTRVFLQPIAAPSILGLFGFAGATFIVAANLAGWYGGPASGQFLFPFALAFGGVAQFAAGMWAFRARDAVATAMHGMWGSFWIGWGVLQLLGATGALRLPTGTFTELGFWFIALAVITGLGAVAAAGENLALTAVLGVLTAGAACAAVFYLTGSGTWRTVAGWVLIASAALAAYTAGAMMIAAAWGRTVLPLGELRREANMPGAHPVDALQYEFGEPGVKQGQ
jgi:succinate-acetate transporter protein